MIPNIIFVFNLCSLTRDFHYFVIILTAGLCQRLKRIMIKSLNPITNILGFAITHSLSRTIK